MPRPPRAVLSMERQRPGERKGEDAGHPP